MEDNMNQTPEQPVYTDPNQGADPQPQENASAPEQAAPQENAGYQQSTGYQQNDAYQSGNYQQYQDNNYSYGGGNNVNYQQNYNPVMDETPMSMGDWVLTILALMIPCAGIILYFVWAFGKTGNINRRNYCRATLIIYGVVLVLYIILMILFGVAAVGMYS